MRNVLAVAGVAVMGFAIVFGLSVAAQSQQTQSKSQTQASAQTGVKFQPSPDVMAKANSPMPGPNAKQQGKQGTIGKGKAMVKTSKQDNSFWVEEIDLDGSGHPVEAQMLWDDMDKVLYIYADKTFQCANGDSGNGDFLMATYAKGNKASKPAGAGWWMAGLDKGECKARQDEAFGCKFNASGKNTSCGVATLNEKTNDLTIVEATTTSR
jgi:hypothetical protein